MRTPGIWGGTLGKKKDCPRRSNFSSVLVAVLGAGASVAALALGLLTCVASSRARSRMGARSWSDRPASSGPSPPASPSPSNAANSAVTSALPTTTETGEEAEEEEEEEEEDEDLRSRHQLHYQYQQQLQHHREQAAYLSSKDIPSATTIPVALPPPPRHHHHLLQQHQQIKNPSGQAPPAHRHSRAGGGIRVATTLDQRSFQVGGGGVGGGGGANSGNGGLTAPHGLYHGAHQHLCLLRRHHGLQAKAPPTPSSGSSSTANTASTASSTASGTFAPHLQTPAAPMLQMESAMERLRQGVAAQRDRLVRLQSVRKDIELGLPPSISLPDGEEMPYGAASRLHLRDSDQESEIYQKCVRAPPNRTIFDGESPPPYRSNSAGILALGGSSTGGEWSGTTASVGSYGGGGFVRCHSISTSTNACERTAAAAALAKKDSAASLGSHRSSSGKGGRSSQHQCQKASSTAVQKGMAGHPTGQSVKVAAPGQHKMGALPYHCQPQAPPPPPQPPPTSVTVPIASQSTTTAASSPVRMSPPPQPNSNRLGQVHPTPSALQQTQQQCPRQYQPNPHPRGPLASTHSRINVSPQPSPTLTPTILVPTSHVHKTSSFPVGRSRSDQSETVSNPSTCPSRSHQLCEFSTSPKAQLGVGPSGASGSGGLLAGLRMVPCMGSDRGAPCSLGREVLERHSAQDVSSASAESSVPQTPKSTTTSLSRVCETNWEGSGGGSVAVIARDAGNSWDSKVLSRSAPEVEVTAVCKEEGSSMTPVTSSVTATDPPSPAPHEQSSSLSRVNNF